MNNRRNFTRSDDALILEQPVTRIGLSLAKDYDGAVDTRVRRCSDGLVDPLLERLKQVHGDRK
jgi:hypothetical protein